MNDKGFTMIELLISAAIFALVIGGLTLALRQQQKQNNVTQEAVDLDQTARATLDYLSTEIRNAVSRQGKTFALSFVNGGSSESPPCSDNTADAGTEDSPPDCLTVITWDITKGQNADNLPSIPANVQLVSPGPPLVLQLPNEWFLDEEGNITNILIGETEAVVEVDLGFRSRTNLCNPANPGICGTNPEQCTECAVILRAGIDGATKQATIDDNASFIHAQNFRDTPFTSMNEFINGVTIGNVEYGFIPTIASQVSEMTLVQSKALRVDTVNRELEVSLNAGPFQPIAGGTDAPGIVDIQYVFNLQDLDGAITKVGVPLDAANRMFPDFQSDPSLVGRQKDIRSVEIYLIARSKVIPQLIRGGTLPVQTIPKVGDVLERDTDHASLGANSAGVGFIYRTFSTTVYIRNMAREEFG